MDWFNKERRTYLTHLVRKHMGMGVNARLDVQNSGSHPACHWKAARGKSGQVILEMMESIQSFMVFFKLGSVSGLSRITMRLSPSRAVTFS